MKTIADGSEAGSTAIALSNALDPAAMLPLLKYAVSADNILIDGFACSVELLRHKPETRSTILYRLAPSGVDQREQRFEIIGKLYARRGRRKVTAHTMFQRLTELHRSLGIVSEDVHIPAPMMLLPGLGIVLQEYFGGDHLDRIILHGGAEGPITNAAKWLARLHRTPPISGLSVKTLKHEARKVDAWIEQIPKAGAGVDVQVLSHARKIMHDLAARLPPSLPVMIHRDYFYENIICDGERVAVIDFDQLSTGEPAMDVGHFVSHLAARAYEKSDDSNFLAAAADIFLNAYLAHNPISLDARLEFFKAYTLFKLAFQATERKPPKWRRHLRILSDLACGEAERGLARAA